MAEMPKFEYGPLREFEITWANGHVEKIKAHQAMTPASDVFGSMFGSVATKRVGWWHFHGEIDGRWTLVLSAREEDIRTVRETSSEEVPQ